MWPSCIWIPCYVGIFLGVASSSPTLMEPAGRPEMNQSTHRFFNISLTGELIARDRTFSRHILDVVARRNGNSQNLQRPLEKSTSVVRNDYQFFRE